MKKNAKTVLILFGIAMIFVTVFAVISFTFSWFNDINLAQVTSVNMTASESEGILLSGNGLSWSSTLDTTSEGVSIDIAQDIQINSISSSGTVIDGELQFYSGDFSDNAFHTTLVTDETLFYVFDFYVLNNNTIVKELLLSANSFVNDLNGKDIDLSTRIAFIKLGTATSAAQAILLDGTGVSSLEYIWEPNSTIRSDATTLYHQGYLPEGKLPYEGVNREATGLTLESNLVVDDIETPELEVVDVITYDPTYAGESGAITTLASESITKLRVYIWVEGQDIDCNNSISGGTADITLHFNTYDTELSGSEYVPVETFDAPIISNNTGVTYTWNATTTNLLLGTYSTDYVLKISKYVSGDLLTIRTVSTTETSLNIDDLEDLGLGEYYVQVKVYSETCASSAYSNSITFNVLTSPVNLTLTYNEVSWDAVTNADSYTVKAVDQDTQAVYTATVSSATVDLSAAIFNGSNILPSGKQFKISVKANGVLGYANSEYSIALSYWT